ncbi:MAG: carbon-nitrogen hydrolase [Patescibacteria group bacterium]
MNKRIVTIGLIQMRCSNSPDDNLTRALAKIDEAVEKGAKIVCLPELFLSTYFCQRPDDKKALASAEKLPNKNTEAIAKKAKEHGIVIVGGSLYELGSDGKRYNTSPIFGPDGKLLGIYRKTHIPEDILYHEQHYFASGDLGIRVFETPFGKICPLICFDQWFPEAARIAALKGAEIIFYSTAIGTIDESVEENITGNWEQMWRSVQVGHGAANSVYIAAANRVGKEDHITFWGGSFVSDPSGAVLAKGNDKEEIIIARCDLNRVKALQDAWGFLRNRRPETYQELIDN